MGEKLAVRGSFVGNSRLNPSRRRTSGSLSLSRMSNLKIFERVKGFDAHRSRSDQHKPYAENPGAGSVGYLVLPGDRGGGSYLSTVSRRGEEGRGGSYLRWGKELNRYFFQGRGRRGAKNERREQVEHQGRGHLFISIRSRQLLCASRS